MSKRKKEMEAYLISYKMTGESTNLINSYQPFIQKYYKLLTGSKIELKHFDVRYFISCYIPDENARKMLLSKKNCHTQQMQEQINSAVNSIRNKFKYHSQDEIYSELLVPFLECAEEFVFMGVGFEKYLYKTFKFNLIRRINELPYDLVDSCEEYDNEMMSSSIVGIIEDDEEYTIYSKNCDDVLNESAWINGEETSYIFQDLNPHERHVLVRSYINKCTDNQIAEVLSYNPKSIHRIRKRLKEYFFNMYVEGNLRCIRL